MPDDTMPTPVAKSTRPIVPLRSEDLVPPSNFGTSYRKPTPEPEHANPFATLDIANRNYAELHSELVNMFGKLVGQVDEVPQTEVQPGMGLFQLATATANAMDIRTKHIRTMMTKLNEHLK
jgi:hypothetical protein